MISDSLRGVAIKF